MPKTTTTTILGYEVHPDADLFPLMEGEAFEELKASIEKHGLREPIALLLHNGHDKIIDGRNRARACEALGRPRRAGADHLRVYLPDGMTPAEYVAIQNLHRRHLTTAQRKELAGKLGVRIKTEQAAKRKADKVNAAAKAGQIAGVSERTAASAMAKEEGRSIPVTIRPANPIGDLLRRSPKTITLTKAEPNVNLAEFLGLDADAPRDAVIDAVATRVSDAEKQVTPRSVFERTSLHEAQSAVALLTATLPGLTADVFHGSQERKRVVKQFRAAAEALVTAADRLDATS